MMDKNSLKGTRSLIGFMLKQQRMKIIVWLISIVGITLATATAYPDIYPDEEARYGFAITMDNPAMIAMLGPGYEMDAYLASIGPLFAQEMLLFTVIAVIIMNILLVGRTTRADEEDGRVELIRALSVGRLSYTSASMFVILFVNVLLTIFTSVGLSMLDGMNVEGAFLYGSILGATGLLFAACTALFAQLAETSRGTMMLSFTFLIISYLIRAIGDVNSELLSFISPLGWAVQSEVFADNHWWPVFVLLLLAVVVVCAAFYLNSIRDIGSGFIAPRKGKEHASAFLKTPFGLVVNQNLTNIISWAVALFLLSAAFGAILGDLETYYADLEMMQVFLAGDEAYSMSEQFVTLLMAIMSLISVIPAIMIISKLKSEEKLGRVEHIYSRAVSRSRILGSHVLLAIIVAAFMQSLVAFGLWVAGQTVMEDALTLNTTFASSYVYLPAMWTLIAIAVLFVGAAPKLTIIPWLYVVYCFIILYLEGLLDFPKWMVHFSIFEQIPQIPIDDFSWLPLIVLFLIGMIFVLIGFFGYNKRDIAD